jgi:hypothetical protein
MKVGLLTLEQKEDIQYKLFAPDSYFHAVLDGNDNWIITQQQMDNCINPDYLWVKELPLIDWVEPEIN